MYPNQLNKIAAFVLIVLLPACQNNTKEVAESPKSGKPNIVIFLADDLGFGDLSCYGNTIINTPHIDKFATEGVRMTDFHSGGTVCSPSRAALLTGRNPYRSGFFYIAAGKTYLKDDEYTIADLQNWMAENDPVRFELYDISTDPSQSKDISKEHPDVVASMKVEMTELWRAMKTEGLSGKGNIQRAAQTD